MQKNLKALRPARARRQGTVLLACAALTAGVAFAQTRPAAPAPRPMATPAPSPAFAIRGFKVTGENPLGDGETSRILAPYLRTDATIETLQQATAALEAALRDKGFGLHRVALPPQEVGDTVTLNIVTFKIDKVTIEGRSMYDEANIRRSLPELREKQTPNFKTLAIQTAIANENPNKQIQVGIRESDEPDKINANIAVKEQRPWTLGFGLSNAGSDASGNDRVTISGGHTNLWNLDHQFVAAYTTSLEQMSDVKQLGLQYKAPLYTAGGVIGATYTRSDVVGNFGAFSSTGAGHTLGLSYTHYLPPDGGRRSYVTAAIDDKVFNASKVNDVVVPGTFDRRSRPITVGYTARTESDTAVWGYSVDLAVNTGSGSGNDLASYQSEDARIDTVRWKALHGGFHYLAPFATGWTWGGRVQWQYSPDVLLSGEQFGLGGLSSVRGTDTDRPVAGDKGVSFQFEVTTPEFVEGLRALAFVDGGWVGNNAALAAPAFQQTNRPTSDSIGSLGLGLRFAKGNFSASADYGRLFNGSRVTRLTNPSSPQKGDDRFYVNVGVRF